MKAEHFSPDIQEWFCLLHAHGVRYLLVGGHAVIYHGYARLTGDVDIFYDADPKNVRRLYRALEAFWEGAIPGVQSPEELAPPGLILQFGRAPNRLDLLNSVDGVDFQEAWENRVREQLVGEGWAVPIYIIGRDDLRRAKKAAGRPRDLDDLERLGPET